MNLRIRFPEALFKRRRRAPRLGQLRARDQFRLLQHDVLHRLEVIKLVSRDP